MIFLIGFMGSGKSTIGRELAKELNCDCLDTDQLIEEKQGMTIKEIFNQYGEHRFREIETEVLKELKGGQQCIVMTGGGMAERRENRELMKRNGKVIWLNCSFEETARRIAGDHARPLIREKGMDGLKSLYERRVPFYQDASDFEIETVGLTIEETVEKILTELL
ncbi:shikimate kinase [Rossellomorea vietnamensis]|uniref:Shikimate kinase n=1 Tax=Rossellomorea vietnamensis TaxID=218284 RepID=A0A5D4MG99_9BACI|nr:MULTISPECIES: shikimate kinase [Bacillaceae]TYS00723.1 shikimate kinase [Rossellomorea vietnamensis]